MTEQLYRWVKASKRLPEKPGRYFVKVSRRPIPDNGEENQVATFTSHKEWYLENHHHSRDFYYINPDEWLEPIPSLNAGSLEEAAKKYSDEVLEEWGGESPASEKNFDSEIFNAFLAGAAYVKGGEEKVSDEWLNWFEGYVSSKIMEYNNPNATLSIMATLRAKLNIPAIMRKPICKNCDDDFDNCECGSWEPKYLGEYAYRPSLDIDKVVDELRKANPWLRDPYHGEQGMAGIWNDCCNKLKELLNKKQFYVLMSITQLDFL